MREEIEKKRYRGRKKKEEKEEEEERTKKDCRSRRKSWKRFRVLEWLT